MKKFLILVVALLLAAGLGFGAYRYQQNQEYLDSHVFLDGDAYPKDLSELDLGARDITPEYYEQLQALLPDCRITWNVPFQGGKLPSDTTEVTVAELTAGDVELLEAYIPSLTAIHAEECDDYAVLAAAKEAHPEWTVDYFVAVSGKNYHPTETKALTLETADASQLMENLQYLPELKSIHFPDPSMTAEELRALAAAYPQISFTWEKSILGQPYSSDLTELDLSGIQLGGVEALEGELAYFPNLKTVFFGQSNLDSETLAAYRDRVRDQYKVVWMVKLGRVWTRTDTDTYMPIREEDHVRDIHLSELKYCEDLIVVDLGHMGVEDTEWIYHTPKLQFLILADTDVSDITPIGTLKELIYLELFKSPDITDYTPLLGCTALQDLNLAFTNGDVNVLAQMTWLDSLWANYCGATEEEKQFLRDSLPNTLLELDSGWHMGNGWRDRPNYYVMRDILKMPYYDWGSKRLAEINKKKYGTG